MEPENATNTEGDNANTPDPDAEGTTPPADAPDPNTPDGDAGESGDEGGESDKPPALSHEDAIAALEATRREAANYRTRLRDAENRLSEAKTPDEVSTLVAELRQEREQAERALLVENVALKFSLPPALADRLQGNSREELEADAKALASLIPSPTLDDADDLRGGLNPLDDSGGPIDPGALARAVNRGRRRMEKS